MAAVADDEPPDLAELARYQQGGRAWVAVDHEDQPVANLLIDEVDGTAHVEQVLVDPNHAHQRLGRALIDLAEQWGRKRGSPPLILTTYAEVPWNAPYYRRLGFSDLADNQIGPVLHAMRDHEKTGAWTPGPGSPCPDPSRPPPRHDPSPEFPSPPAAIRGQTSQSARCCGRGRRFFSRNSCVLRNYGV